MSKTDAGAGARESAGTTETVDYDAMLDTVDTAIEACQYKIEQGRIRDPDREKVRCKQWRTLGYLVNVRRQVANDRDLQELAGEIDRLKEQYEGGKP